MMDGIQPLMAQAISPDETQLAALRRQQNFELLTQWELGAPVDLSGLLPTLPSLPLTQQGERRKDRRPTVYPRPADTDELIASVGKKVAESGMSLLTYAANVLDKPAAAVRGLLAGEPSHLLLLVPFSESYLRGFVNSVVGTFLGPGEWVPRERIYSRDLLEKWAVLQPNKTGFHPVADPEDAVGDALGLVLDVLITPPLVPAVGPLSAKAAGMIEKASAGAVGAKEAFRGVGAALHAVHDPQRLARLLSEFRATGRVSAATLNELNAVPALGKIGERGAQAVSDALRATAQQRGWQAWLDAGAEIGHPVHEELVSALGRSAKLSAESGVRAVREAWESGHDVLGGLGVRSPAGFVEQLGAGERSLLSFVPWRYPIIGEIAPQIDIPIPPAMARSVGKVLVGNSLSRGLLSVFHWTTGGALAAGASQMRQRALDLAFQLRGTLHDMLFSSSVTLGKVAGAIDAVRQKALLAGDATTGPAFDRLATFVAEYGALMGKRRMDAATKLAKTMLGEASDDAVSAIYELSGTWDAMYSALTKAIAEEYERLGLEMPAMRAPWKLRWGKNMDSLAVAESYMPRAMVKPLRRRAGQAVPRREDILRPWPTHLLQQWAKDPLLAAEARVGLPDVNVLPGWHDRVKGIYVPPGTPVVGTGPSGAVGGRLVGRSTDGKLYLSRGRLDSKGKVHWTLEEVDPQTIRPLADWGHEVEYAMPRFTDGQQTQARAAYLFARTHNPELLYNGDAGLYAYWRYIRPLMEGTGIPDWHRLFWSYMAPQGDEGGAARVLAAALDSRLAMEKTGVVPRQPLIWRDPIRERDVAVVFHDAQMAAVPPGMEVMRIPEEVLEDWLELVRSEGWASIFGGAATKGADIEDIVERYVRRGGHLKPTLAMMRRWPKRRGWGAGEMFIRNIDEAYSEVLATRIQHLGMLHSLGYMLKQAAIPALPGGMPSVDQMSLLQRLGRGLEYGHAYQPWATTEKGEWVSILDAARHWRYRNVKFDRNKFLDTLAEKVTGTPGASYRALEQLLIPRQLADSVEKALLVTGRSGRQNELVAMFDRYMEAVKAWFTVPWPAFHVRNLTAAYVMGVTGPGKGLPMIAYAREMGKVARAIAEGTELPFEGELKHWHVLGGAMFGKTAELGQTKGKSFLAGLVEPFKEGAKEIVTPGGKRGAREVLDRAKRAIGSIEEAGRLEYARTEAIARAAAYSILRRKGMEPAQAAEWVARAFYDYERVTPVERAVLRRVFPFYGWLRQNLGAMMGRTLFNWASGPAKLLRILGLMQLYQPPMPQWMYESLALALPQSPDEAQTLVIRQWGLPIEDLGLFQMYGSGRLRLDRTLERLLSRATPLLGAAYRLVSKREPWTGQPISGPTSVTGLPWADALLSATPLARMVTEVDRLAYVLGRLTRPGALDVWRERPRQLALDLAPLLGSLTGIKLRQYDIALARLFDQKRVIEEALKEQYPYVSSQSFYYVPERFTPGSGSERALNQAVYQQLARNIGEYQAFADLITQEIAKRRGERTRLGPGRVVAPTAPSMESVLFGF